ncbi:hypothetical protein [Sansalvadorimonas verongulae]|uniref:hypothetical protein n=1 Tax=Sansalvadorimonas verongulae TaxID=2172824 RepID=UPI0012BBC5E2|nr:hypothetical protein [Sansalvadorimonas verongulae]MTI14746.1 hypothetical protein [Sansalvadorimonas verongulae]
MEREVRHPYLFTLCGFVLCVMFLGNLARADSSIPPRTIPVYLNMSEAQEARLQGNMLAFHSSVAFTPEVNMRVFSGDIGVQSVRFGEWITVHLTLLSSSFRCRDYQNQYRLEVGKNILRQGVVVTPRLTVEGDSTVCRLDIIASENR